MPVAAGTRFGPYEILALVGAGGMGEVYRAKDTRLDRIVAMKVLPAHLAADAERRQRFEREARAISTLNHPHICTLHDIGSHDGVDFLVMEYLEGETLAERLRKGALPLDQALRYAIDIAGALGEAHRQGVFHRDLKPGNIMLTGAPGALHAKLLDFGLAKLAEAPQASPTASALVTMTEELTSKGSILGTAPYMAPEQLEGKLIDARTDVFSFGAVLYEMATGRKAFEGKSQASVIAAILVTDPPPISSLRQMSPPALDRVAKKCLAKEPDERWQNAHDLKSELQWIAEDGSQAAILPRGSTQRQSRERLTRAAAVLLLLVVAVLVAVIRFRAAPQPVQLVRSSLLPPPNSSFQPYNFAVSPDGTRLAFVAVGPDGKNTLWVRALSTPGAQQLNGADGAMYPFWSPDSHRIGFFAEGKLKTVDIARGAVAILCQASIGRGGAWSRDDTIVFAPSISGPLYRVPAAGGVPAPVTKVAPEGSGYLHLWPAFLPDGNHFLYVATGSTSPGPRGDGIYVGSLSGGDAKLVAADLKGNVAFASGNLLYVRERSLMAQPFDLARLETSGPAVLVAPQELDRDTSFLQSGFTASENGVLVFQSAADAPSRLVWFDSSGNELGQLPDTGYNHPSFSPDGRFLAVSSDDERNGKHFIRILDLERGVGTRLTDGGNEEYPVWSRDGKHITYLTGSGSISYMDEIPSDGSGAPQVLLKGAPMIPNDWSPDGHLVFMDIAKGLPRLAIYSAADHQVTPFTSFGALAQFSPDGKWVAQTSAGNRSSMDIIARPFPGPGGLIQISSAGGAQPRWSRDGRRIFYIQPDKKLMEASFDSQKKSAGAPRVLFQTRIVAAMFAGFHYDVAPDGRFLINSFPSNHSSPLTLLTGWTALLKGR